jgi:hypothetical protein
LAPLAKSPHYREGHANEADEKHRAADKNDDRLITQSGRGLVIEHPLSTFNLREHLLSTFNLRTGIVAPTQTLLSNRRRTKT